MGTITTTFLTWFRPDDSYEMLPEADWMNSGCKPALNVLAEAGIPVPQASILVVMQRRGGPSHATVTRALRLLEDHGMIRSLDEYSSLYELTDLGRDYLNGELDPANLEP